MQIKGHGIDIVDTARIGRMLEEHREHFLDRCFTPGEQAYCGGKKNQVQHLAGRFAAKEAILKVIGTGWRGKIAWTDMEILPDAMGKPELRLTGETARLAAAMGITAWHLSISHISTHATASAIGVGA